VASTSSETLTCRDVIHQRFGAMPATATVADVRTWFGESSHRRMAFLADGDRYAGSITRAELEGADDSRPASEVALTEPTVAPEAPASEAYALALLTDARRVPVVDADGRLLGVVAVTVDHVRFCGTPHSTGA
jgi:CBS domain-containing protein